jgi:MSHA biogenesis protein MshI
MLSLFRGKSTQPGRTGLHRSDSGLAIAQIRTDTGSTRPRLTHCQYHDLDESRSFVDIARHFPHRNWPAVSVLSPSTYNMLLVEAPDVPDEELKAAVKWRIKDLLDFHIDDAVIEVFQMPLPGRGGPTRMMYAIAAREQEVQRRVDDSSAAGLNLEVIDILELSLRNIAMSLDTDEHGVALMYLNDRGGVLLLVRSGVLYLARHVETNTEQLRESTLHEALIDGLALEVQRSLDYCESHYEQNTIPVVYTWGLEQVDCERLDSALGIDVRALELSSLLDLDVDVDARVRSLVLPAIGGALRVEAT